MSKSLNFVLILSTLPLLQGCIPAALVGGTASLGTSIAEERKFGDVFTDAEISATINAKWIHHDSRISELVGLQVNQGRVLLTGIVDTPLRQIDAVRLAWEARGVKEVIDETRLGNSDLKLYASDSWITTKLKTEMLFNQDISSINYNIKTVGGIVYLIGIAQNQQELDQVMNMARKVNGVKNIVNYVNIKGQPISQRGQDFSTNGPDMTREAEPIMMQPASNESYGGGDGYPSPRAM
jgi:osmotically-inducible protein OsmY